MLFDLKAEADMRLHSDRMAAEFAAKRRERRAREAGSVADGETSEPAGTPGPAVAGRADPGVSG